MSDKEKIYEFLKSLQYMELATASLGGKPEVATIKHVVDGDWLLVNTRKSYRKYKNMTENPQVACVATFKHEKTLQFDGDIEFLEGDEESYAKEKMLKADPKLQDFFFEDTCFFKIKPTWMRLRDYTVDPIKDTIVEL